MKSQASGPRPWPSSTRCAKAMTARISSATASIRLETGATGMTRSRFVAAAVAGTFPSGCPVIPLGPMRGSQHHERCEEAEQSATPNSW